MTLVDGKDGQRLTITRTAGSEITLHALRFGIGEGSSIQVQKNIPGGPVIVLRNQLEIAIGRQLACLIEVMPSE
ncbi:MAG TPA: ferrous iron transport protein A [Oculatellaceae cyanobacterium]